MQGALCIHIKGIKQKESKGLGNVEKAGETLKRVKIFTMYFDLFEIFVTLRMINSIPPEQSNVYDFFRSTV